MDQLEGHLRSLAAGQVEALGPLADWCDENGRAEDALKLRQRLRFVARRLREIAEDADRVRANPQKTYHDVKYYGYRFAAADALKRLRKDADAAVRNSAALARKLFKAEWKAAVEGQTDPVSDIGANLRRIYGVDAKPGEGA